MGKDSTFQVFVILRDMWTDELSKQYADLLDGSYNCVDRIVLNAYCTLCHSAGGLVPHLVAQTV